MGMRPGKLYYQAFQYYSFARFPTPNSAGKKAAYEKAVAAYLDYAKFDLPKLEVVRIPFEGKQIVGYLSRSGRQGTGTRDGHVGRP